MNVIFCTSIGPDDLLAPVLGGYRELTCSGTYRGPSDTSLSATRAERYEDLFSDLRLVVVDARKGEIDLQSSIRPVIKNILLRRLLRQALRMQSLASEASADRQLEACAS